MSEVAANNAQHEKTVEPTAIAAAPELSAEAVEVVEEVAVDAAAAGDAANAVIGSKLADVASSPKVENKKTPAKRTPSKRMSFIERAQKESEELVKNMGGSLELEGGRRTRSSMRGTPTRTVVASTPPPTKKARTSPANAPNTTPSRARGRGRKIDTSVEPTEEEAKKQEPEEEQELVGGENASADEDKDGKATSGENAAEKEQNANDTVEDIETAKAVKPKEGISDSAETSAGDEADAVLEIVPEEKQNNVDHVVGVETQKPEESTRTDSPMDTDEPLETEVKPVIEPAAIKTTVEQAETTAAEKKDASVETVVVTETKTPASAATAPVPVSQKEPTPEPMEVDSSSKSNDVVEVSSPDAETSTPVVVEEVEDSGKVAGSTTATSNAVPEVVSQEELTEAEDVAVKQNSTELTSAPNVVENDLKSTSAESLNSVAKKGDAEPEPEAQASNDVIPASESKPENDFCEPKIASPPMNAASDGAATTPQYCN